MNYYAEAIKALESTGSHTDWRALVFKIAAMHPKAIIDAMPRPKTWQEEVKEMAESGATKIQAIKRVREMTSMGLKEAKDAVESLIPIWPQGM